MLKIVRMCALRAIEEVFLLILFGFGVRGVDVWVGDLGRATERAGVEAVPSGDDGGEGGDAEDVAVGRVVSL